MCFGKYMFKLCILQMRLLRHGVRDMMCLQNQQPSWDTMTPNFQPRNFFFYKNIIFDHFNGHSQPIEIFREVDYFSSFFFFFWLFCIQTFSLSEWSNNLYLVCLLFHFDLCYSEYKSIRSGVLNLKPQTGQYWFMACLESGHGPHSRR